jgi:ribonucrease Y
MENYIIPIIVFLGILTGACVGYFFRKFFASRSLEKIETKIKDAEERVRRQSQEIIIQAKEESLRIVEEAKKEEHLRIRELRAAEQKLEERRSLFDKKLLEFEEARNRLINKAKQVEEMKEKVEQAEKQVFEKLQEVAGLSAEEAKTVLFNKIEKENQEEVLAKLRKLEKEGAEEIEKKANEIVLSAIERYSGKVTSEKTTSVVDLPSDEMKGRIIGREGRNIRTIESLTGAEIVIDDTPGAIVVSSFSPLRREVAKRLLNKLIADGRIQPARVERFFSEIKKELGAEIKKIGEEAAYNLGIVGLPDEIIKLLGRLHYRTSYGQNVLSHSIEVANFAASIAAELKANVSVAKKAGLLHDLGKALDQETEGTHPELGKEIAERYNLPKEIVAPIATHHEDHPTTLESIIVKAADAISSSRPGARSDSYENYIHRLEDLEQVATGFLGVEKVYAIEAGREIRVFVNTEEIDDLQAEKMARDIAKKIEETLNYPGEIRVTVIREKRITDYAR